MDGYATADCANETSDRPLDNVPYVAEEAEATAVLIRDFISRFRHGPQAPSGGVLASGAKLTPVPSGHVGQLTRLRDAVAELNKLARELGTIG